jgi:DNA-binding NarL/FixJ family response regulator
VTVAAAPTRVLIVDSSPSARAALRRLLTADAAVTVMGEAGTGVEALALATASCPDVTLLEHPNSGGAALVAALSGYTRVLLVARSGGQASVRAAVEAGAHGYLVDGRFSPNQLAGAIRAAAHGLVMRSAGRPPGPRSAERFGLTRREREIMDLVARGLTNKAIADQLYLAPKTVRNHINRLFAKLGVSNRQQAVQTWRTDAEQPAAR